MYTISPITSKQEWEDFMSSQPIAPFLQSWNAGEQEAILGNSILRLGVYKNDQLEGVALVVQVRAKRGAYLYLPYGPVLKTWDLAPLQAFTDYLKKWGRENGFWFIRMSPYVKRSEESLKPLQTLGYRVSPLHMLAEELWVLPLDADEDELLMGMRKTNRNLIRKAKKVGVSIEKTTNDQDVNQFLELLEITSKRHDFVRYSDKMIHAQVDSFKEDDNVLVFRGIHEGNLIASSVIMYYGNAGSYHHGASIHSKIPVAYLMQWEAIVEAKRRGCREYNFWGIVDTDNKKHPFYNISHFKKGFGGELQRLIRCHDLAISPFYIITYIIETIRRIRRGFGWKRH